jgi:very-short-patch-repair endonuclease
MERKRIRKEIKWEDPFTSLIWSVVRKKRLQGRIFRCEHRIPGIRGREILATFYCAKYRFILEPLTARYTYAQKRQDRFLYERGYYVHRIRETDDKLAIHNEILGIFSDYSKWKRELGLFLHVSYKYLFWINREIQSNLRG